VSRPDSSGCNWFCSKWNESREFKILSPH